jgi:hypothetical protein
LPSVVLLHQIYYIFAMTGFFLGCIDYTRQKCILLITTN